MNMARRSQLAVAQVYFTTEQMDRLRRVAEDRGISAAAIVRGAVARELDEIEALPPGFMSSHVRKQVRRGGPQRRKERIKPSETNAQQNIER